MATETKRSMSGKKGFSRREMDFKDKEKPVEIRTSNITAAKGIS